MTAVVGIQCDGCGKVHATTTVLQVSVGPVRDEAKALGWHKTRGAFTAANGRSYGYARDICPDCWAEGKR